MKKHYKYKSSNDLNNWLQNAYMASWWLTWEDLDWPSDELEEKWVERAVALSKNGVNTVAFFGFHFRWDYIPIIDRTLLILGRIRDICHDHGMKVVDHHSAVLVHRPRNIKDRIKINEFKHHATFYPDNQETLMFNNSLMNDWRTVDVRTNKAAFFDGYICNQFCPNNQEFQKGYLQLIKQTLEVVRPDAIMSDDVSFLPDEYVCTCEYCRARFRDETGLTIPPVTDVDFWNNRSNPDFQKWIQCRYRWNAEHHKRLREYLPKRVALWGCMSDCVTTWTTKTGQSILLNAQYWDVVFMEIFKRLRLPDDEVQVRSEIAAFSSVARMLEKPLLTIIYAKDRIDLDKWLALLAEYKSIPWVSKAPNCSSIPEEELLIGGFDIYEQSLLKAKKEFVTIPFSFNKRDQLSIEKSEQYIQQYRLSCNNIITQGYQVDVKFDDK